MILYDLKFLLSKPLEPEISEKEKPEEVYSKVGKNFNAVFEKTVFIPHLSVYMYSVEKERVSIAVAKLSEEDFSKVCEVIRKRVEEELGMAVCMEHFSEITVEKFRFLLSEADNNSYIRSERRIMQDLELNYEDNNTFGYEEEIYTATKCSLTGMKKSAKELLVSDGYQEELERIFSKDNIKQFFEHPVHYHVIAESERAAKAMTDLLIKSLLKNKRLLGGRVNRVVDLTEHCYNEQDFEHLVRNSQGATVILPLYFKEEKRRSAQNQYEEALNYIEELVRLYHKKVLFVFQEITSKDCTGKSMLKELEDDLRLIRMQEGAGCKRQAKAILYNMIKKSEYGSLLNDKKDICIPDRDSYSMADVYRLYADWVQDAIYHKVYKSYGTQEKIEIVREESMCNAYVELQNMVGLDGIKSLVDQILAMHKLQRKRRDLGLDRQSNSLHMIFSGNPGSAKTSVARLLAYILYNEGIINNKKIVECGRGDLVGKYVGWTAKQVQKKFSEAKGGILFIDEAYALIDGREGSFGDEAINTIVQEMENRRDEVIVIFAGYPKKMEEFLQKNEGLRSRITFHLDFPNYSETELEEILKSMIKQRGFYCEKDVYDKCREIFRQAVLNEDFGNGRYVRNLLEQAILRQSKRLVIESAECEIATKELNHLVADDFEVSDIQRERGRNAIGFHRG